MTDFTHNYHNNTHNSELEEGPHSMAEEPCPLPHLLQNSSEDQIAEDKIIRRAENDRHNEQPSQTDENLQLGGLLHCFELANRFKQRMQNVVIHAGVQQGDTHDLERRSPRGRRERGGKAVPERNPEVHQS